MRSACSFAPPKQLDFGRGTAEHGGQDVVLKLSVKSDYAARAVLWLSQHYHEGAARTVEEMASAQSIPPKYLVQILIELKSAQIVKSQRGKDGGYMLARAPGKISFGDVLRCIHGEIFDSPALNDPQSPPELRQAWRQLREAVNGAADAITFQQLLEAGAEKGKMYYI
jgi:Rrf2 family protein